MEEIHWADKAADKIIKEKGDKKMYTIAAGITPSGTIHAGNFREIITIDLIERALKKKKKEVRFIYSWDDYDVFRKVPVNLPKQAELKKHLRKPISAVPDPFGCHSSYAEHFEKEVEETLPAVDIKPGFLYQHEKYKKCEYAGDIKKVLENTDVIKSILNDYRKDPLADSWLPISMYCDSCGLEMSNVIYKGKYIVSGDCSCGQGGEVDFSKKGLIKVKWRADWPMRWNYEKVDFESGGKDHFAAGGSFDTGKKIIKAVWKRDAPTSSRYEWIRIKGGKQFSSSKGEVITLKELLEIYEPEIVRYMFASTRAEAEFAISFDADVIKIYEDFDTCERIAFGIQETNTKEMRKQRRIYDLSAIGSVDKMPFQASFRHLTTILQIHGLDIDASIGFLEHELKSKHDRQRLEQRAVCAKNWLEKYAPEEYTFVVQEKVAKGLKLTSKQKQALKEVGVKLNERGWTDVDLHNEFYVICSNLELSNKEFFEAAYQVLVAKSKGPRLASFILQIGKEKVSGLFGNV
jgi:lysyl-tRNA synthetase, class I